MKRTGNSEIELPEADAGEVNKNESVSISRIQLILAEKRTTLAVMRTGIGVFTIPLSVITVLVATSRYYDVLETYHLLVPLLGICAGLIVLGIYLVHRSVRRIRKQDALINRIKQQDPGLVGFYRDQFDAESRGSGTRWIQPDSRLVDQLYPHLRVDFVAIKGSFGPELVEAVSRRFRIPKNHMFIGTPGDRFPHRIEDLGGVRVVL